MPNATGELGTRLGLMKISSSFKQSGKQQVQQQQRMPRRDKD
jgi:hypothetical protein